MNALFLYHPQSDHARTVEEFARDFSRTKDVDIELVSLETKEGADAAKLYDIVAYPALLVLNDDGGLQKAWLGDQVPLMDEVASYLVA